MGFKVDWRKMDLGDIVTLCTVLLAVAGVYWDTRSDIRANDIKTQEKFIATQEKIAALDKQVETRFEMQKKVDQDQNERMIRMYDVLTKTVKEVKDDIRSDIKDLKTDIAVRSARGGK